MTAISTKTIMRTAVLLSAAALAQAASAACYMVYAPNNELIYRSNRAPVDLSQPLHQTVSRLSPGATMVFSLDEFNCATEVNLIAEREQIAQAKAQRAQAMRERSRF